MCADGDDNDNVDINHNIYTGGTEDQAVYGWLLVMILVRLMMPTLVSYSCHMTKPNVTWERSLNYRLSITGWPVSMTLCIAFVKLTDMERPSSASVGGGHYSLRKGT